MPKKQRNSLALIAVTAIRAEELRRGEALFTPQLMESTINLMVQSVKGARKSGPAPQ